MITIRDMSGPWMRRAALLGLALLLDSSAASGGAWVQEKGHHWLSASFFYQETDERYFLDGRRIPYFFEGHNQTAALFVDWMYGLGHGLEVKAQLPFFTLRFDDLADERRSTGIGDVRAEMRWSFLSRPLVATLGFAAKLPTGGFVNDAEVVPVGEGQVDYDLKIELGRSLWPRPAYVTGTLGYRFRALNQENGIDHGDELIWEIEAGYQVASRWTVKGVLRGLYGFESTSFDLPIETLRREVVYVEPSVIFSLDDSRGVELAVPVSLRGRNWPAGPVVRVQFFQRF